MSLKPWYKVVTPREDLRDGKPLDASEFAVHLDQIRIGEGAQDYVDPKRFLDRTYMTRNLGALAAEVMRRLSGEATETSAVFNLATQFGGGKTHALTLLYHLVTNGPKADRWTGVPQLLDKASVSTVPKSLCAVLVGTEFDSITGRGGNDGTPLRKTPWGEIAWQLGAGISLARGKANFELVAEHDAKGQAPGGEVIRKILPNDYPSLILLDEVMNLVSRSRKSGLGAQFYNFLQNLSEVARSTQKVVLAVSIPASELEMTVEDQSDYERFKKMLDRLGKAMVMSAESETSEIIRRRLFEWDERAVTAEGKVILNKDAQEACKAHADWVIDNRQLLPNWFNIDGAREQFADTYPFHPTVVSVFERKWQQLPRFQQTRGVLRLLALWVSRAYQQGFKGAHKDSLIGLGTAPLEDDLFRAAVFEQLGESKLEGAVTTDICGKKDSHAVRMDAEATDTIKNARLHRQVATSIFFESNGGQAKGEATLPEVRLAVGQPGLDIGNVETVIEALAEGCYYLNIEGNRYRFGIRENLNKRFADRRATIQPADLQEQIRTVIQKEFASAAGIERALFPEKTSEVPDRPVVTLVVLSHEHSLKDEAATMQFVARMVREYGSSARTFKSALIFCVPESPDSLQEDSRRLLAWEAIDDERLNLDDSQRQQLQENIKRARRDLREAAWRTYKNLALLGKDNAIRRVDLGLITSSAATDIVGLITNRLRQEGDLETGISAHFLARNWPPAFTEWSTKSVRDAFYASPQFPRITSPDVLKDTISSGVANGVFAYVGKGSGGTYKPFVYNHAMMKADVEFSDDVFIVTKEVAEAYAAKGTLPVVEKQEEQKKEDEENGPADSGKPKPSSAAENFRGFTWSGEIPGQKWMNFYTRVLAKFSAATGMKLTVRVEIAPEGGVSKQKIEETKKALAELGLQQELDLGGSE
ncbi:MAG: hypothetical protein QOJ45_1161 [Verrucomicrobiota bacterium]|jgi:hypothetical protein